MSDVSIEEREFISLLISLYRDRPELWKIKCKDYSNKDKKSLAIKSIVNVLKIYKSDYDDNKLKKKINVLRTNFNKEYLKIERRKRSGASSDDIQEPTLWYYNEFLFIKDQLDIAESESSEQLIIEEATQQSVIQSGTPNKKRKTSDSTQQLTDLAIEYFKRPDTESDILAKGWAMKLNRVAPDQRRYAEKIINDTIFEAEMGTLTRNGVRFLALAAPSVIPALSPVPHSSPASHSSMSSQSHTITIDSEPNTEPNTEQIHQLVQIPDTGSASTSAYNFQNDDSDDNIFIDPFSSF